MQLHCSGLKIYGNGIAIHDYFSTTSHQLHENIENNILETGGVHIRKSEHSTKSVRWCHRLLQKQLHSFAFRFRSKKKGLLTDQPAGGATNWDEWNKKRTAGPQTPQKYNDQAYSPLCDSRRKRARRGGDR